MILLTVEESSLLHKLQVNFQHEAKPILWSSSSFNWEPLHVLTGQSLKFSFTKVQRFSIGARSISDPVLILGSLSDYLSASGAVSRSLDVGDDLSSSEKYSLSVLHIMVTYLVPSLLLVIVTPVKSFTFLYQLGIFVVLL